MLEIDTKWDAVHDEVHMEQDDSVLEHDPSLNWTGYNDNYIRKEVTPNHSSRDGSSGLENKCFLNFFNFSPTVILGGKIEFWRSGVLPSNAFD